MGTLKLKVQVENNKVVKSTYSTWYNVIRSLFPKTATTASIETYVSGEYAGKVVITYKDENNDGTVTYIVNDIIGATHKDDDDNDLIKAIYDDLKDKEDDIADYTEVEYD